ncbi:TPA: hypothetical protein ACKOO2_003625 [Clostridioides difficile]|uniref:hypothetical protein n=4 Tax=Clostridioides difficile TaxID=1496 RepID=UPI001146F7DA|nr:hypothetical protein [Clostridioides difficile]MCI4241372.1 hypothetical protein [Clostridioides difficile]MDN9409691.1 hypothetical protein [Clostridioides difficile]MDO0231619.1 hypothetical protein [Clostridioides difficile]MDW0105402.1 hypothetical protein [Clostridioides difficile]HBE9682928.1 hypothetical protein [Clostridioides difficile]
MWYVKAFRHMTTAMNIVHFILTMWYVNNITKWMFSKNKEGFRLTMWYVNDKFYRFVSLVKEECRKKEKKENK